MGLIGSIFEKLKNGFEFLKQTIFNLPNGVKVLITLCILAASVLFVIASFQMYLFITFDSRFCLMGCHPATDTMIEPYYLWQETSHNEVTTCHDCHHGTMLDTMSEVYNTFINRYTEVKKSGHIGDDKCLECHDIEEASEREYNPLLSPTVATLDISKVPHMNADTLKGHGIHITRTKVSCVACHGLKVHRFIPPENVCEKCHYDPVLGPPEEFAEEEGEKSEH